MTKKGLKIKVGRYGRQLTMTIKNSGNDEKTDISIFVNSNEILDRISIDPQGETSMILANELNGYRYEKPVYSFNNNLAIPSNEKINIEVKCGDTTVYKETV